MPFAGHVYTYFMETAGLMVLGFFLLALGGSFVYIFTIGLFKEATKKGGGTYEVRYRDSQTIIDEQKWLDEENGA